MQPHSFCSSPTLFHQFPPTTWPIRESNHTVWSIAKFAGGVGPHPYHAPGSYFTIPLCQGLPPLKKDRGIEKLLWWWGCWEHGNECSHRSPFWNQHFAYRFLYCHICCTRLGTPLIDFLYCHICCTRLGTPWHKIVGASRAVSNGHLSAFCPKPKVNSVM